MAFKIRAPTVPSTTPADLQKRCPRKRLIFLGLAKNGTIIIIIKKKLMETL